VSGCAPSSPAVLSRKLLKGGGVGPPAVLPGVRVGARAPVPRFLPRPAEDAIDVMPLPGQQPLGKTVLQAKSSVASQPSRSPVVSTYSQTLPER